MKPLSRPKPTMPGTGSPFETSQEVTPPGRRASILLVDDQEGNLRALEAILRDLDQELVLARSGQEALFHLIRQEFAVVLLDVRMPDIDGFETAELIRRRQKSRHTPIIFVTAVEDTMGQMSRGYAAGCVDYITKPINADILKSKVRVFVDLHLKTKELIEKNATLEREILLRERVERELARARDSYLALFDDFPALIWRANPSGSVDYVNRSWLLFSGRPIEEELGQGWIRGIHPQDVSRAVATLEQALRAREPFETEFRFRSHTGEYRWLINHGRPYQSLEGNYAGFIGSCTDISRRRASEEATRAANEELEAFSYTVSHDLRAPLRAIAGFCQILIEDYRPCLDETGKDYLERIDQSARQMDDLIRDLLTFSRLGRTQIEMGPVDLEPLLSDVASIHREGGADIDCQGSFGWVAGNAVLLRQVFSNLVSNGIKFVPENTRPRVRITPENTAPDRLRVWVEDNGIGIDPDHHERIFQVFERLNSTLAYPGTGIGLAIVRKAIACMKGRVGVESAVGKGSRFWVELSRSAPLATLPPPLLTPDTIPAPLPDGSLP
jgi:PAS domain S-box-containing protein